MFEQKTVVNKIFLLKKFVNMKLKEGTQMIDHLNVFQSIVSHLAAMKMVMDDDMQAFLLLCSLPNSQETFVVTISNSALNGALSMELMKGNLFNEKTRRKAYDTENAQALIIESKGRNRDKGQKGYDKFEGRSQSKGKIKCFHCGKDRHMKRNYRIWKREQNRQNQEKEYEKNTTTSVSNNDEFLVLSNECLHVDKQEIEWTIDIVASYHATPHIESFFYYKVKDFGVVKMGNSSHSKIVGMGDVCFETNAVQVDIEICKACFKFMP